MSIIRVQKHTDKYVILDKTFLEDQNISLKLKGFLAYCLSKPDHWEFRVLQLATVLKEGRDAIRAVIQEGEQFGYISSTQSKSSCGQFSERNYVVHELSIKKVTPETAFPAPDTRAPDYQAPENPTQASNDNSKERNAMARLYASAQGEEKKPEAQSTEKPIPVAETIFYKTRQGGVKSITRSEIFRNFAGSEIPQEVLAEAINNFTSQSDRKVSDPIKIIKFICDDLMKKKMASAPHKLKKKQCCDYSDIPYDANPMASPEQKAAWIKKINDLQY